MILPVKTGKFLQKIRKAKGWSTWKISGHFLCLLHPGAIAIAVRAAASVPDSSIEITALWIASDTLRSPFTPASVTKTWWLERMTSVRKQENFICSNSWIEIRISEKVSITCYWNHLNSFENLTFYQSIIGWSKLINPCATISTLISFIFLSLFLKNSHDLKCNAVFGFQFFNLHFAKLDFLYTIHLNL